MKLLIALALTSGWQTTYQYRQSCVGNSCSMVQVPVQTWVPDTIPSYEQLPLNVPSISVYPSSQSVMSARASSDNTTEFRFR